MNVMDEVLVKMGLKYEDLTTMERETLNGWYTSLQKNELTVAGIKGYLSSMRETVEQELEKFDNAKEYDIFLKARLKNYRLLEGFLTTPERAREALERSISSLVSNKK